MDTANDGQRIISTNTIEHLKKIGVLTFDKPIYCNFELSLFKICCRVCY